MSTKFVTDVSAVSAGCLKTKQNRKILPIEDPLLCFLNLTVQMSVPSYLRRKFMLVGLLN